MDPSASFGDTTANWAIRTGFAVLAIPDPVPVVDELIAAGLIAGGASWHYGKHVSKAISAYHASKSQPLTSTAGHSQRRKKSTMNSSRTYRRSKQIRSTSRSYSRRKNYYDRPKYRYRSS